MNAVIGTVPSAIRQSLELGLLPKTSRVKNVKMSKLERSESNAKSCTPMTVDMALIPLPVAGSVSAFDEGETAIVAVTSAVVVKRVRIRLSFT